MTGQFRRMYAAAVFAAFLCMGIFTGTVSAVEVLQNTGFENYDAGTLVPDSWEVIGGGVQAYTGDVNEGGVSVYSPGGTAQEVEGEWAAAPNSTQGGTMVQLIDLSSLPDYAGGNWINLSMSMYSHLWSGTRVDMILEYLPPSYDASTVTASAAVWDGPDAVTAMNAYYEYTRTNWRSSSRSTVIPKVRWARVRFVFDAEFAEDSDFTGGEYYIAVDTVSVDAEVVEPETPCTDNLLNNPGFESATGNVPDDWHVLSGRMTAISNLPSLPAYSGSAYAGNIGGTVIDGIDNPDPPQLGFLMQLVDLSTLPNWTDASFITFTFSGFYIRDGIGDINCAVYYLPESYNDVSVACDDAAWGTDAQLAVINVMGNTNGNWKKFEVGPGTMPKARWVRVQLFVNAAMYNHENGPYLGGFDQVCLQAVPFVSGDLIQNASFDNLDVNNKPVDWHPDPADGDLTAYIEMLHAQDGMFYQGKVDVGSGGTGRIYQVIDLADRIPGWTGINPYGGATVENRFIQIALSAYVANIGGTSVKVGLEYLPYSYNSTDGVTWDSAAWQPRDWVSDGSSFTNNGGDAIDLGALIDDAVVTDPYAETWRAVSYDGWLPRVRWLRLRIELDAAPTPGGTHPIVAVDKLELSAQCTAWGPYSGFGSLPEATFFEDPNAPDKAIPAWVGPEGDGISGGYTGQTERNYVNPAFAGFADAVASYSPSGENIYNETFMEPLAITGSPWNDAGWNYVIITLGDLSLEHLADYFGPAPSGEFHPGEITASFDECPIINGPGPDFVTFENGFSAGWTTPEIFAELAYVEVSTNGTDFIRFPTHSLTPKWPGAYGTIYASGVFGLTGKHINAYGDQWGTPFDLDWIADHPKVLDGTVDLNNIRYVKQVDLVGGGPNDASGTGDTGKTGFFFDSFGNVIFDSWPTWGSGGADLDAVAVMNSSAADTDGDHIVDYWDNCSQTSNDNQYDTDGDGYGNMCDCDIDGEEGGDGTVNVADFNVLAEAWLSSGPERIPGEPGESDQYTEPSPNWNADADFNGDNTVNMADFNIMTGRWLQEVPYY